MLIRSTVQNISNVKHVIQIACLLYRNKTCHTDSPYVSQINVSFRLPPPTPPHHHPLQCTHLIPAADLHLPVIVGQYSGEVHEPIVVEDALDVQAVAVPREVVPLVHVDPVPTVRHDLRITTSTNITTKHH